VSRESSGRFLMAMSIALWPAGLVAFGMLAMFWSMRRIRSLCGALDVSLLQPR
jgi:hypothetical protein